MKTLKPTIRKFQWKDSKTRWMLQGFKDAQGRYVRRVFKSRAQAEEALAKHLGRSKKLGELEATFGPADAAELAEARESLAPFGRSVRDAVAHYVDYLNRTERTLPVAEFVDLFLKQREADGIGVRSIQDLRSRLNRFAADYGEAQMAAIETRDVDEWLRGLGVAPQTRNNFRRTVHLLFSHAEKQGYTAHNPVKNATKAQVRSTSPEIFTPSQMLALITAADPRIVPALAIGAFAGLRRAEIDRLDWSEINPKRGYIEVLPETAKTASRRLVSIRPNLAAWLAPYPNETGKVRDWEEKRLLKLAMKRANLKKWPKNGLRHSFASYALAEEKDAAALSLELGHTSPALLFRHYRELVQPEEAKQWWSIEPETKGNLVAFKKPSKRITG